MKSRKCSLKAGMSWFRSNSPWTVSLICALNMEYSHHNFIQIQNGKTSKVQLLQIELIIILRDDKGNSSVCLWKTLLIIIRSMFGTVKRFSPPSIGSIIPNIPKITPLKWLLRVTVSEILYKLQVPKKPNASFRYLVLSPFCCWHIRATNRGWELTWHQSLMQIRGIHKQSQLTLANVEMLASED